MDRVVGSLVGRVVGRVVGSVVATVVGRMQTLFEVVSGGGWAWAPQLHHKES